MTDFFLESLRALLIGFTILALIRGQRTKEMRNVKGWKTILYGFVLIFFGTLIDITDNFPQLDRFIIVGDTPTQAFLEKVVGYLLGFMLLAIGIWRWLPEIAEHQAMIAKDLEKAEDKVNTLHGLLPICASCKKIRDDEGYWKKIETYISEHSDAEFSHSICPACTEKLYSGVYARMEKKNAQKPLDADKQDAPTKA